MHNEKPVNAERSLLDEIEELQVLEAEELQEGVAFHAFRFRSAGDAADVVNSVILTTKSLAESFADKLIMPRGATLLEVRDNKMLVVFDNSISVEALKKNLATSLGTELVDFGYKPEVKYTITQTIVK